MIKENLARIQEQIAESAKSAGRERNEISLVAVSKFQSVEAIAEAFAAGQILFGENYIQEITEKRPLIPEAAKIHFIGHLQSNKAKFAAEFCDMIETVDSAKLARKLNTQLELLGRSLNILLQINIGNDPKKAGVPAAEALRLHDEIAGLSRLRIAGLMTIPPFENTPEESRPYFANLRKLGEKMTAAGCFNGQPPALSMGMSADFPVAIAEGATIVRVGTAIFGVRPSK